MAESRLINSLPLDLRERVLADVDPVQKHRGDVLEIVGQKYDYIHFPSSALGSLIVTVQGGNSVEASTVGSDGFVEVAALLGVDKANITAIVQVDGEMLRMRFANFQKHLSDDRFRAALGTFAARAITTMVQSTACNAFHPVMERLAKWLLLVRDGLNQQEFRLTQDFMAVMLGVHRPTVTIAIRTLESAGVIDHARGLVRIVNAAGLAEAACECYRQSAADRSNQGLAKA